MLNALAAKITQCLIADQFRLRRSLQKLKRLDRHATNYPQSLLALQDAVEASLAKVEHRRSQFPLIQFDDSLPVAQRKAEVAKLIKDQQVVIIAGETGSGKTTQIPKICLELGLGSKGLIGHTQPRRIAARSVATRIAQEVGQDVGQSIGYQVRFSDNTSEDTLVKLMTDGILLAEIQRDRYLNKYEVIIIDEAHERSLNIDFLLGYLRQLLSKRPDLKLIITSATIDVEKFSQHFSNAPVITVEGRTFPVEIMYRPPQQLSEEEQGDGGLSDSVISCLREIEQNESKSGQNRNGDVLVFLSGEREIRDLANDLRKLNLRDLEVLPLYARLTPAEQQRIFAPHRGRRIVLATNVAETSLTVPGIIYVIDTGFARISRYSVQSKVQRLPIEPISQASANQRSGRCGRVSNGICYRLYSFEDFQSRPEFTDPEIRRTNLSAVILQMLMLGLGDIENFPFVEKPDNKAINDGFRLLHELGAITKERKITRSGRQMATLPTDPRLSRILLEAHLRGCLDEMLIIVSALSVQDPKESPPDKRQAAQEKHREFIHPESDFASWVILWTHFEEQRQALKQSALRKFCQQHFLSYMRMREWRETHRQLHLACAALEWKHTSSGDKLLQWDETQYEAVHRSIIRGSLNQLACKNEDGVYLGSRNRKFSIFPTSALFKRKPKWIVTGSLIETSRLYATLAAKIAPQWAVEAAGDLLKRDYYNAHWEKRRGQVVAFERITLFGLCLVEKQAVNYGKIDPALSREIFIREALVEGQLQSKAHFYQHNQKLIADLQKEEDKLRRPDILVSDDELYDFYDNRIPVDMCDARSLERWLKTEKHKQRQPLHMAIEDLVKGDTSAASQADFPERTNIHDNELSIDYRFAPGAQDDGASIAIPLSLLSQMRSVHVDWAIPGQIRERCISILKGLPKGIRKNFIPVPDFVDSFMQWDRYKQAAQEQDVPLQQLLAQYSKARKNIALDPKAMSQIDLPLHVYPLLKIVDDSGELIAQGHDLKALQDRFAIPSEELAEQLPKHPIEKEGIKDWDFGELPQELIIEGDFKILRYPALIDGTDSVAIRLADNAYSAQQETQQGLLRLFILRTSQQKNMVQKSLKSLERKLALKAASAGIDFGDDCLKSVYAMAFDIHNIRLVRNKAEFDEALLQGRGEIVEKGERFCRLMEEVIEASFAVKSQMKKLQSKFPQSIDDVEQQLSQLIYPGYLLSTPAHYLLEYPRYLKAIQHRLDKLPASPQKDLDATAVLQGFKPILHLYGDKDEAVKPQVIEMRWMLEELRVSLFAQTLKTKMPISAKRVEKRWEEFQRTQI
ncbi:MAG: ATP-dependent RNA helicase HrpA [Pseudohongiellaceae bacterium]|nr:ATP-dependent RNA helicase HrpA [Pseudohongiellaceae bacterium]